MISTTVEEFVKARVLPEFRETVERIRLLLRELAPQATEELSYGIPAYRVRRIIAVISPTKKDITLSFSRGADFEDKLNLLKGAGNKSKHLKFKNADEVERSVLAYYIRQALELETRR
ncbi:MAG TPA: DUF1801 domain-containing protein [Anaerolineaceae bacterium]|nr:DUF1801 domain-containing protein [Anaerolineaceae bacterium]